MITYVDTSAALKLIVAEAESSALAAWLDSRADDDLVASRLLRTELFCAADRRRELDPILVRAVVERIELFDVRREDLDRAATSGWGLRSADAIHLACALRLEASTMVTYDAELAMAAGRAGLVVARPGAPQELA